ncbi:hypothetical protein STEG23_036379 [Scotinomys teguina]
MKFLVLLLCFAQLWGCQSAPHHTVACDDPEVEQIALMAVDYLNQHLLHGFRHTLNQIDKVKVWSRRPFGDVYELEVDTLETTCHALDPTPLANCSVRQVAQHAVEGDCDFHVLKQDGQFSVLHTRCHSTPDSAEDVRKICPNCPLLAQHNDTNVVHAVDAALAAFNEQNKGTYFKLVEISRAQNVPLPVSTSVEFVVAATDCTAQEVTDPAKCNLLAEKQYGFCKASLVQKLSGEEVSVTCTIFPKQPKADSAATAGPTPTADQAAPAAAPADPPASLVVGPMVVAVPPGPPAHRTHHDLRHAFSPVASVESASGETVGLPNAGAAAGPAVQLCPGRHELSHSPGSSLLQQRESMSLSLSAAAVILFKLRVHTRPGDAHLHSHLSVGKPGCENCKTEPHLDGCFPVKTSLFRTEDMGSLFYLTLDVLETDCHVLSKKAQKDCNPRSLHQSVYGQCKAMFHINKPQRVLYLLAYNCTLRPVSQRKIHSMCPDCPGPVDLSDPRVLEAATESLAKFNSENPSKQYSLFKVIRATSQWVVGPSYFVDYLIKESSCTKSQASCSLQSSDSVPAGLCHGSLIQGPLEKSVSVTCEIFESQAQVPGGENPAATQEPQKQPSVDNEAPQKGRVPVNSPSITAPKGSVQHLPDLDAEKPEASKGKSPEEAFPVQLDLTTDPQGEKLDVSFLYLGPEEKKLVVLPFPGKEGRSTECPGPAEGTNPLILPP